MKLQELADYLSNLFSDYVCEDYSNNGLQVEASSEVEKVAFAVDACKDCIDAAADAGAQLLVVHHGISWGPGFRRIVGTDAARFSAMFGRGVSLFAMHLPLDAHRTLGNNAVIADRLGLVDRQPFCEVRGLKIGVSGSPSTKMSLAEFDALVKAKISNSTLVLDNTGGRISRVAVVSGQCSDFFSVCAENGIDCVLTGEVLHQHYHSAREYGVSVIAAGHYETETWGVRALQAEISRLGLETIFIDAPTGL